MGFIFRMVFREMRTSWRRFIFFFFCIAVGVSSIVVLRSLIQSVRTSLTAEAKTLTGADVLIQTQQPWTAEGRKIIEQTLEGVGILEKMESIDLTTMVRSADEWKTLTTVVELRGVQSGFPIHGDVVLESGQVYFHGMLNESGALVRPELLTHLGIDVGDKIIIGATKFTIRGVILSEPGSRLGAFSLGPRVLIGYKELNETGLVSMASRARREIALKIPEEKIATLMQQLKRNLRNEYVNVRSYRTAEDRVTETLLKAENYLSLVGFVVVILGGIGVWSVTRVFVHQKIKSIAILKCLGATTKQILATYLMQVTVLGLGGSLLGVIMAAGTLVAIPERLTHEVALATGLGEVSLGLTTSAVMQGIAVGVMVSVLFSVVPLFEVRQIKPFLLLRWDLISSRSGLDWTRLGVTVLVAFMLVALASWQAASLEVGFYVCSGFVGITMALHLAAVGVSRSLRPLSLMSWFPLRQAVKNLCGPQSQTRMVLLVVGLGSFSIIGIRAVQVNLLQELALEVREDSPDMFLIDVQGDQVVGVRETISAQSQNKVPKFIPILRARVVGVRGRELSVDGFEEVRRLGSLAREYTITYRDRLEANERIIDGEFWGESSAASPEVSVEASLERRFGIHVGDTMRFDVLGRIVTAKVTSIREVDWDDSRSGGFMFLFRPGVFNDAPHTFVGLLKGPSELDERASLQRALVESFPNVSVIDGLSILKTVKRVIDYVALAISIVGIVALLSGVLILVGSIAVTKFKRLYEVAILKTLGATTRMIMKVLVIEYGLLGTLAGIIGAVGALILSWVLSTYVFEIRWYIESLQILAGIILTVMVVGLVGVLSNFDVLMDRPLATLRTE